MQKICIVIPCYNEAERLDRDQINRYLETHPHIYMLGVNDGSSDDTLKMLQGLEQSWPGRFMAWDMPSNGGKAEAVRNGVLQCLKNDTYDYIGYWDADFSTPLEELDWFIQFAGGELTHRMIIGSRVARLGSKVQRKIMRHYLGRIFSTVTSNMLRLRVYDTQCGAKLVKADEAGWLFEQPFGSKWFFDVEILARLINRYGRNEVYEGVLEIPLRSWLEIKGSKLKLSDFIKVPLELLKIKRKYKL